MEYITVGGPSAASLVEKRSRFLADLAPVKSEEEAARFIAEVKAAHPDARHHVFAYILRSGAKKYADDGEPQGTAGLPILEVLSRRGVVDAAVVVTRYFGGILLGAPGLLRAYSGAAAMAMDAAELLVMRRCFRYEFIADYSLLTRIERLIGRCDGSVENTVYEDKLTLSVRVPDESRDMFLKELITLSNGGIEPTPKGEIYCA